MALSIDFGGTNIRIAEVTNGKIKNKRKVKTPKTKNQILDLLFNLIDSYKKPNSICIGIAAFVKNGKIHSTPNIDFNNVDLKNILNKKYKVPIYIDNDANCAGLGELYYGYGRNKKNFVLLTLGTGIGGAIIINNKLYHGKNYAGEPGHMLMGGKMFEKEYQNYKKIKSYKKIGNLVGKLILNISYILDPEIIIIGGGFANNKQIFPSMKKVFHEKDIIKRKIPIIRAKLKDDAGLIGAAQLPKN